MKNMLIVLLNLILLSSCVDTSEKVQLNKNPVSLEPNVDSIAASKVAIDFYTWYAEAIRLHKNDELLPTFVEDSNGMTTLDMYNYSNSLRKNKFSQNLIDITTSRYTTCSDNLKNIPYDSLKNTFELSDYENILCNFSDYYQWTNDMDPLDGADVVNFTPYENDVIVRMLFYNIHDHKKSYWKHKYVEVVLTKTNNQWLIDNIQITFNNESN